MSDTDPTGHYTTIEAAELLGMAVRSVQLMVDRGELTAWKTPGGHRRISRKSVERWLAQREQAMDDAPPPAARSGRRAAVAPARAAGAAPRVLLIEDSVHYQNLVRLLFREAFPQVDLSVAEDGIVGLAMAGQLQPDVLVVDILLPGIDGATLIGSLGSHPQFSRSRLIVMTSLDEAQRAPYAFALKGVPVVHKSRVVADLPGLLAAALKPASRNAARPG